MRLFAMCAAAVMLMQLPASAAISTSLGYDLRPMPLTWGQPLGRVTWDEANHTLSFYRFECLQNCVSAESGFAATLAISLESMDGPGTQMDGAKTGLALTSIEEAWLLERSSSQCLAGSYGTAAEEEETFFRNIRIAGTSVAPEPATLTIWGLSALALAAATYRRQKRAGRNSKQVQGAVQEYLDACTSPADHFRMLGGTLAKLADDPAWSKQDIDAFYDEVVVALHRRREHAAVA